MGLMLFRELALKEGDLLRKTLGIIVSTGERCRVSYLHS
jgi:hypothetical protein